MLHGINNFLSFSLCRYHNGNNNRGGQVRNHVIPNEPPFTAYIGNAPDTMVQGDFEHQLFVGLKVKQVRLVRDRQTDRFRGIILYRYLYSINALLFNYILTFVFCFVLIN